MASVDLREIRIKSSFPPGKVCVLFRVDNRMLSKGSYQEQVKDLFVDATSRGLTGSGYAFVPCFPSLEFLQKSHNQDIPSVRQYSSPVEFNTLLGIRRRSSHDSGGYERHFGDGWAHGRSIKQRLDGIIESHSFDCVSCHPTSDSCERRTQRI